MKKYDQNPKFTLNYFGLVWSKCNMWYLLPTLVLEKTSHISSQLSHAAYSTCLTTTFLRRDRRWIWVLESKSQTTASRAEAVRQYRPVEEKVICLGGTACPSNFPVSVPNSRIRNRELDTLFRNRGYLIASHWCAMNLPMKNSAFWDMNSALWNKFKIFCSHLLKKFDKFLLDYMGT